MGGSQTPLQGESTQWKYDQIEEWHEMGNVELHFPDIYILVLSQRVTITEMWTPQGWNLNFRRQLNDWEVIRVAEFLNIVGNFDGLQTHDVLWWKGHSKGIFKVGSAYRLMEQSSQQNLCHGNEFGSESFLIKCYVSYGC